MEVVLFFGADRILPSATHFCEDCCKDGDVGCVIVIHQSAFETVGHIFQHVTRKNHKQTCRTIWQTNERSTRWRGTPANNRKWVVGLSSFSVGYQHRWIHHSLLSDVCYVLSTVSVGSLCCGYTGVAVAAVANQSIDHHGSLCRWVELPTLPAGLYCFLIWVVKEHISTSMSGWYPCC